jgi:hypothetical protein
VEVTTPRCRLNPATPPGPGMAGAFCSVCGRRLPFPAAFCAGCGTAVPPTSSAAAPPAGTSPPLPTFSSPTVSAFPSAPVSRGAPLSGEPLGLPDRTALSRVEFAAILSLVGVIFGLAVSAVTNLGGLVSATTGSSGVVVRLPPVALLVGVVVTSVAVELAGLFFYRTAFRTLAPVDRRFSTPSGLALVAIVGLVLAVLGVGLFLAALYEAVHCVGAGNPITQACLFTGTFYGGTALLAIGAIVAVVGYIGVLVGIWRLGSRYERSLFKVGAILLLIPYLNLVGAILIWAGARGARREVEPFTFPGQVQ